MRRDGKEAQRLKATIRRLQARVQWRRRDMADQASAYLSQRYERVCVEDLQVKNMTKSARGTTDNPGRQVKQKTGLNRSILNSAPGLLREKIRQKIERYGGELILVPPQYTSQRCSHCGHVSAENRQSQAVFECVACGHSANADTNAAMNIAAIGLGWSITQPPAAAAERVETADQ